jgi:hypothetical protein
VKALERWRRWSLSCSSHRTSFRLFAQVHTIALDMALPPRPQSRNNGRLMKICRPWGERPVCLSWPCWAQRAQRSNACTCRHGTRTPLPATRSVSHGNLARRWQPSVAPLPMEQSKGSGDASLLHGRRSPSPHIVRAVDRDESQIRDTLQIFGANWHACGAPLVHSTFRF